MALKENPIQTSFSGGIQSPLLKGHVDAPRRDSSYADSQNLLALKQGPLVRRGGTRNVYETVTPTAKLLNFEFNDEQAYVLELSSGFMRVYRHEGVVVVSGSSRTITGITAASPPVVTTSAAHPFIAGNWVNIASLTEAVRFNDQWFRVGSTVTGTTFELFGFNGVLATAWPAPATAETSSTGTVDTSFFLVIPYLDSDLFDSDGLFIPDVVQSNDVMFIVHPDFEIRILARTADDAWTIVKMSHKDGPYLKQNTNEVTMTLVVPTPPSRVYGVTSSVANIVVTSDTLDAASGGDANDLGTATESNRQFAINADDDDEDEASSTDIPKRNKWIYGEITKFITTTTFEFTAHEDSRLYVAATNGNETKWKLGAYSDTTGYPSVIDIHEGRLVVGANNDEPRRIDFSAVNGFGPLESDWTPHSYTKEVEPDFGFTAFVGGGNAAPIQWVKSSDRGVLVGTNNSEGIVRSSNRSESLTPENASYKPGTTIGSRSIQPLLINGALLFVQFAGRRLHELSYSLERDTLVAPDMTELAEHLTRQEIIAIAHQQEPIDTVWGILGDGSFLGFTYERNSDIIGWHRHMLGGVDADIQSQAIIPVPSENRDELWQNVSRTINGFTRHYVERMERYYEDDIIREDIYHMDSGVSYVSTEFAISAATAADPVVVTTTLAHGRSNGDRIYIKAVLGMTEINTRTYICSNITATTIDLQDITAIDIDGTGFTAYTSGGTVQESIATFRALDYLEAETLQVYVDGNTHPDLTVTDGAITLSNSLTGANVSVGLPKTWLLEPLLWEAGSRTGTSQGSKQRINHMVARLFDTLDFNFGPDSANTEPAVFDNAVLMNSPTGLFTGDLQMNWPGASEFGATSHFTGDGPFPVQIQSLIPHIATQDPRT